MTFYQGDVMNKDSVKDSLRGYNVVLCTLGAGKKGRVRASGTKNIVEGMKELGIKRFICQTTLGCGESLKNLNFILKHIMFGWLLKDAYKDHEEQEKLVKGSPLDWTIIRPAAFTDGPLTEKYKYGFSADEKNLSLKVSRVTSQILYLKI